MLLISLTKEHAVQTNLIKMPAEWKRPESVPFPNVWMRFEGKKEINGKIPKFWIQDIPEDMFEEVADFMCKNFIYEEPLCKYLSKSFIF